MFVGVVAALALASPTHADPAAPGDYRSEVVAIDPPTSTIGVRIVGGDSFVELRVDRGVEAFVLGYENDDYLWFRADGAVFENRASRAAYLNADRYAEVTIPDTADAEAEPVWRQVASGGRFAWHDHRAHWMLEARPVDKGPGDVILDQTIPVRVDGVPVDIRVVSTWLPAPSPLPVILGALLGAGFGVAAVAFARSGRHAIDAAAIPALAALTVGAWQYLSLPAATGPRLVWIALPAVAIVCAAAGIVLARRGASFLADAALLAVGAELLVWGVVRRDVIGAAVIPTSAPFWLDRAVTAMSLAAGAAFVGVALWRLFAAPQAKLVRASEA